MGSDYLYEVLNNQGDFLNDINGKISEIVEHGNALKNNVRSMVNEGGIDIRPYITEGQGLADKASALRGDMKSVEEEMTLKIKTDLGSCSLDLKKFTALQEINHCLDYLYRLSQIRFTLKGLRIKLDEGKCEEAAIVITNLVEALEEEEDDLKMFKIWYPICAEARNWYQNMMNTYSKKWLSCVAIEVDKFRKTKITIDVNNPELRETIRVLDSLHHAKPIDDFTEEFLLNVVDGIIVMKVAVTEMWGDKAVLEVEVSKPNDKPHYSEVFLNIKKAVEFLRKALNIDTVDGTSFADKLGKAMGRELTDKLIEKCLYETVPTNWDDFKTYRDVVEDTAKFEQEIIQLGFIPENSTLLLDYATNAESVFADKFFRCNLEKARLVMKKDLHDVASTDSALITPLKDLSSANRSRVLSAFNCKESEFAFPACRISKSAKEISALFDAAVDESVKSDGARADRIFQTVIYVAEMYAAVVPLHHRKLLKAIPQQVAIFHNNCMYLSHYLLSLVAKCFKRKRSLAEGWFDRVFETAISLRTLATKTMEDFVTSQQSSLIFILRKSSFLGPNPKEKDQEKGIRQCLRQLQVLESVWKDVLPPKIFRKIMGCFVDTMVEVLVSAILRVEDISVDSSSELVSMFNMILQRVPTFFTDEADMVHWVKKWDKFKELVFVLEARLVDIESRWDDGGGPLAQQFSAAEVRHMIRALFQNSQWRSTLLSKIK